MEKHLNMQKYKLIKTEVNYLLENEEGVIIASTSLKNLGLSLSIKNCQAIENGYDLDELADKYYGPNDYGLEIKTGFIKGFEVAMRLMGDKKFSEGQMKKLFAKTLENAPSMESHTRMISDEQYRHSVMDELYDRITKSLQQTEWDCIVEMECPRCQEYGYISECRNNCNKKFLQPKLDTDNCLILKRK